ncbi:MAG: plasmid pRiA4b ORF-3 family protein [Spirochaetes bacterium]|jgi:hypothetical protein|nr:plasmid pRiA4b ORF-3 family protein [Spirochaetota bacterium]
MASIKKIKSEDVFQLKITLDHIKPIIWRRFLVDSDIKLTDLHKVIQTIMGWTNSHLHQFVINKKSYSLPDDDSSIEIIDYRKIKLNSLCNVPKARFMYQYDFGDGWEHTIVLEKILPSEKGNQYPICIDGKRNCPPEDCGGPYGYTELLTIINNPKNDQYQDMIDWLGNDFDPEEFNIEEINEFLQETDYGCIEILD